MTDQVREHIGKETEEGSRAKEAHGKYGVHRSKRKLRCSPESKNHHLTDLRLVAIIVLTVLSI